jgi:hypothetical protein
MYFEFKVPAGCWITLHFTFEEQLYNIYTVHVLKERNPPQEVQVSK